MITELSKLELWLNAIKLTLNYSQTKFLLIMPKSNLLNSCNFNISLNEISIEKCCKAKCLGIILDENLNWKAHVQHLQKKLSYAVGIIAKLRHYLDPKNLLITVSVYYALFYPHILYEILGWGSAAKASIKPIQILQNKVLRIMNKSTWSDRVNNDLLCQKYKVLKINDLYKLELGKFMYLYHANA